MPAKKKSNKANSGTKPSPVTIIAEIQMGMVELSEMQAIRVSLIRNALQQEYVAVCRVYRTKNDAEWKPKSAIWLPFANVDKIGQVIRYAYEEGIKLGWGNTHQSEPLVFAFNKKESSHDTSNQELAPLELTPHIINVQERLFDDE